MNRSVSIHRALTKTTLSRRAALLPGLVVLLLLSGCLSGNTASNFSLRDKTPYSSTLENKSSSSSQDNQYLEEGVISFSKPVPVPTVEASPVFSFMPIAPMIPDFGVKRSNSSEMWVFIDSLNNSIEINRGDENILTVEAKATSGLNQGKFSVALKEENALWYANDTYFAKRSQRIPAEGSSDRYLKGALGEYAVVLSGGMVIHSSPLFDDSVTGFQVGDGEIRSIYSLLEPGTKVIIR